MLLRAAIGQSRPTGVETMAWSWSHTSEGTANAYDNLHGMPHEWLAVCRAEWTASRAGDYGQYHLRLNRWEKNLAFAKTLPDDTLADDIWTRASEFQTCDNGGFNAWCCPYGCHTVPFSCD